MHHSTRSNDLQDLRFDPDIETMARRNRREARLRRVEMGDRNAQLEHMGLPPMANQNEGEVHQEEIPVQEGLPHVGDERTLRDYIMPRVEHNMSSIR